MVKRTLMVIGVLSLMVMLTGIASAQCGSGGCGNINWCPWPNGGCDPLFVGADCCYPEFTTIKKVWKISIDGPCPPPGMACGTSSKGTGLGGCTLCSAVFAPFDWLFGGEFGVSRCSPSGDGPCGPCFGPVPAVLTVVPKILAGPSTLFGTMW